MSRLVEAGVLLDDRVGRARVVHVNPEYRLLAPLRQIINATYGPVPVLTEMLAGFPGIEEAYIYGSWAARHAGQAGPQPQDIDVLVVGQASRVRLNEMAHEAEQVLSVPVNVARVAPETWQARKEPFIRTIRERPLVRLDLTEENAL